MSAYAEQNTKYYCLTGNTDKQERQRLVDEFQNDDTPVFLISLKAGGTGLNLTAADIVIHYDPWWNVAAQNQATDRAHRIGQKNTVIGVPFDRKGLSRGGNNKAPGVQESVIRRYSFHGLRSYCVDV